MRSIKLLDIYASILCSILVLAGHQAFAVFCPRSTQVSETFTGVGSSVAFSYDINNLNVGRVDFYIQLSNVTTIPTFLVAIDPDTTIAGVPAGQTMVNGDLLDFGFTDVTGRPFTDGAELVRIQPNRYRLSINFDSYYSFADCGPRPEACPMNMVPNACLPSVNKRRRQVFVTIGNLNSPSPGHLQVNAISRGCIGVPLPGHPNEANIEVNPARNFVDELMCTTKPTDVVVVLDHSGSMNLPASMATVVPRITVLNQSMGTFFTIWKTPGQFNPTDDAAAVFFDTTSIPQAFGSFLVPFTATPNANPNLTNLINASTTHVIVGNPSTAMGPGLQSAFDGFSDTSSNYRHIIVFTDGQQNVAPCVAPTGAVIGPLCALTGGAVTDPYALNGVQLRTYGIPIHTIGTGSAVGTPYEILLRRIAFDSGGRGYFTIDGTSGMTHDFLQTLVNIFRINTLGLVDFRNGTINRGAGTVEQKFRINRSAKRVVFLLSWHAENAADQIPGALTMEVLPPGSATPLVIGDNADSGYYHVKNITIPLPAGPTAHEGEWTLRVRESLTGASQLYHAAAFVDEAKLEYGLEALAADYGTGDSIRLQAVVTEDGVPIKNLSTVTARVTRPRTPLGTFMHTQQITPADLQNNPPGQPADAFNSNFDRKLFRLVTNPAFQPLFDPIKDPQPVQLFDDGLATHGDAAASDGIYSALYSNTKFPGQYVFDFSVAGSTVLLGSFSRTEKSIALVRVNNPDPNNSEVSVDPTLPPGDYLITVVPADTFGNFLGPGFANEVDISVSGGGTIVGPITDVREDGTYTAKLVGVPSGANPTVTVKVSGKVIANKPISILSKPKKRFAFFGGLGINFPHGDFNTDFNSGVSTQLGFEYRFTNRVSAEGTFGYDRFQSVFAPAHLNLYRGSGNVKFYPVIGTFQLGVFGGGGVYHFTFGGGGGETHGGVNIGAVAEYRINTSVSLESTYNFHNVFTSGSSTRFSTVQGGVRFRF